MPIFNGIEKKTILKGIDREERLTHFFSMDSIEILLKTNSELLSYYILELIRERKCGQKENEQIIDVFFKGFLNQLESVGIEFWEFQAIINVIIIAQSIDCKRFLSSISNVLRYRLLHRSSKSLGAIIYLYPEFIAALIDVMPEIFVGVFPRVFEPYYLKRDCQYEVTEKMIDYIKIFRHIYELTIRRGGDEDKDRALKELSMIERIMQRAIKTGEIRIEHLTISQMSDMIWYARFTNNKYILREVEKVFRESLDK